MPTIQPRTLAITAVLGFLVATNPVVSDAAATLTGKDIKNGSLTGKDIKNNSLKGTKVKDGSLSGVDVKDGSLSGGDVQVRAATAYSFSDASTGVTGARTVLTSAITAPAPGYLAIVASSDVWNTNGDSDTPNCWLSWNNQDIVPSYRVMELNDANGNGEEDCSTSATIPVAAGAYTVRLVGYSEDADTNFDESSLSVQFVPFGPTGTAPTPAEIAAFDAANNPPIRPTLRNQG